MEKQYPSMLHEKCLLLQAKHPLERDATTKPDLVIGIKAKEV